MSHRNVTLSVSCAFLQRALGQRKEKRKTILKACYQSFKGAAALPYDSVSLPCLVADTSPGPRPNSVVDFFFLSHDPGLSVAPPLYSLVSLVLLSPPPSMATAGLLVHAAFLTSVGGVSQQHVACMKCIFLPSSLLYFPVSLLSSISPSPTLFL